MITLHTAFHSQKKLNALKKQRIPSQRFPTDVQIAINAKSARKKNTFNSQVLKKEMRSRRRNVDNESEEEEKVEERGAHVRKTRNGDHDDLVDVAWWSGHGERGFFAVPLR